MAGSHAGQSGRVDEPSALVVVVDGLIDRVQRSPLMRRAPAQCTPEEQIALAATLHDLVTLRALRATLEPLPVLRLEQVNAHWPELGGLLIGARRGGAKSRPRDGAPQGMTSGGLFDDVPPQPEPADGPVDEETPAAPAEEEGAPTAPASGPDLAHPILEAMTVQGKALNTTQMLTWLRDRGIEASREDVMDTLFRHEELFRRRGANYWVVASQETA